MRQVREAVVALREDLPGDKRLVAYVVAQRRSVAAADLRAWLERQLPDYMVPAAFVLLPALPLTPNGKVDRKSLPAPEYEASRAGVRASRDTDRDRHRQIWAGVLHRSQVGRNESFFDLGGHSLLAAQAIGMINQALGIDLTLRQLFETPTVRELALCGIETDDRKCRRRRDAAERRGILVTGPPPAVPALLPGQRTR